MLCPRKLFRGRPSRDGLAREARELPSPPRDGRLRVSSAERGRARRHLGSEGTSKRLAPEYPVLAT
eukprot:1675034-Alexandrium_andersonii.AAC.1